MIKELNITWEQYCSLCQSLANYINKYKSEHPDIDVMIYGIPRGGVIVSHILSYLTNSRVINRTKFESYYDIVPFHKKHIFVVDDIIDSGNTLVDELDEYFKYKSQQEKEDDSIEVLVLVQNKDSKIKADFCAFPNDNGYWIVFPYDTGKDTISKVQKRDSK